MKEDELRQELYETLSEEFSGGLKEPPKVMEVPENSNEKSYVCHLQLASFSNRLRPADWTSADAAGLPIFPGLVRYDEVFEQREIKHALRFTVQKSRSAYVFPARHYASSDENPNLPPMGMRVRLKASFDISSYSPANQVILRALKKYGMFVADNGPSWFLSGAPDTRWSDDDLGLLKNIKGFNFEVVRMDRIVTK